MVKCDRSYLNVDSVTEDTPTTQLFRDRVVNIPGKVTVSSTGLRHILAYVGERLGYPDDFVFEGTITEVRRQISNSVPPVGILPFARAIKTYLEKVCRIY